MKSVLVAVLGTSPGILTETVWALATDPVRPVVPDEVVVITTAKGRDMAEKELLSAAPHQDGGQTVWETLKSQLTLLGVGTEKKLVFGRAAITVFQKADASGYLEDIRTAGDNELAADFILKVVRGLQGEDNAIIGSVAGGRKTMSTLLYGVFSLIGRPQDRLTHVLVNDPFESPGLQPRFYFPCSPPVLHRGFGRDGSVVVEVTSDKAVLELADIPFVRARRLFQRDFSRLPSKFTTLVDDLNQTGPGKIMVVFDDGVGRAVVNGCSLIFGPREHALFSFMVNRAVEGLPPMVTAEGEGLITEMKSFLEVWLQKHPDIHAKAKISKRGWVLDLDIREISGGVGAVRDRLREVGLADVCEALLPRSQVGWDPSLTRITLF